MKHIPTFLFATAVVVALSPGVVAEDKTSAESKPFKGNIQTIPGVVEAEHFDEGAPDVAYHDLDVQNQGANYREATQVDIEARPDASNGHGLGWTREGEWVVYTVNVLEAGTYTVEAPVASNKSGGIFHLEFDGKDVSGPITVPDTGGWDKLKTIQKEGIVLEAGIQKMKVVMDKDGESTSIGDIDLLRFVKAELKK